MTQMANGLRGHRLKVSGHGAANARQQNNPLDRVPPALPTAAAVGAVAGQLSLGEHAPGDTGGPEAAAGQYLSAVWRTSSYVESIQWELDAAHASLRQAVQQAASSGVDHSALLQAANLTSEELEAALLDAPPA